ncbi:hypothetical protein ONZ45_g13266 [Pleurotus djamor]|nr:hypothetical protein ONZ45_g13266 [Pleurotus djamor]
MSLFPPTHNSRRAPPEFLEYALKVGLGATKDFKRTTRGLAKNLVVVPRHLVQLAENMILDRRDAILEKERRREMGVSIPMPTKKGKAAALGDKLKVIRRGQLKESGVIKPPSPKKPETKRLSRVASRSTKDEYPDFHNFKPASLDMKEYSHRVVKNVLQECVRTALAGVQVGNDIPQRSIDAVAEAVADRMQAAFAAAPATKRALKTNKIKKSNAKYEHALMNSITVVPEAPQSSSPLPARRKRPSGTISPPTPIRSSPRLQSRIQSTTASTRVPALERQPPSLVHVRGAAMSPAPSATPRRSSPRLQAMPSYLAPAYHELRTPLRPSPLQREVPFYTAPNRAGQLGSMNMGMAGVYPIETRYVTRRLPPPSFYGTSSVSTSRGGSSLYLPEQPPSYEASVGIAPSPIQPSQTLGGPATHVAYTPDEPTIGSAHLCKHRALLEMEVQSIRTTAPFV